MHYFTEFIDISIIKSKNHLPKTARGLLWERFHLQSVQSRGSGLLGFIFRKTQCLERGHTASNLKNVSKHIRSVQTAAEKLVNEDIYVRIIP